MLSLVITGVIAVTSLPAVSASAKVSQSDINLSSSRSYEGMGEARALKELTVKLKSTNSSSTLGYVEKGTVVDVVHSNDTALVYHSMHQEVQCIMGM